MNKYHQELLTEIKHNSGHKTKHPEGYSGSPHQSYGLTSPIAWNVARNWTKSHPALSLDEYTALLNSLYPTDSYDEKAFGGRLLFLYPELRKQLDPKLLDSWVEELVGWAEVDSTCQNIFTYQEILEKWDDWKKLLQKFSQDQNICKRRASIVLLTGPVTYSEDPRLADLAFENISSLKHEKDILITKAISWLLRSLIKHHKDRVEQYLKENFDTLPKIAIRETTRKLQTGKK